MKLNEEEKLLHEICVILRRRVDENGKLQQCENALLLLEEWFAKPDEKKDIDVFKKNEMRAIRYAIDKVIPSMEIAIEMSSLEKMGDFYEYYKQLYAFCGRRDLECFIDYMEWNKSKKVLATRRKALQPLIFALNKLAFDPKLELVTASYPPSYGKSFCLNYYSAWRLGMNKDGSSIRLSYSIDLVTGFSRAVKDLIASEPFADIFHYFKHMGGKCFEKEKETDWKIKGSENLKSYIARTREGSTTGERASLDIILDDMLKGETEAVDDNLHTKIYNKWLTEWSNRDDGMTNGTINTKFVIVGTMWSPDDIINKVNEDYEKISPIIPHPEYKWVWTTEDGSAWFIKVPALDENDESTCPAVKTTAKYRQLRDNLDPYYFACVYQQSPIPPTGLEFASDMLRKFEYLPKDEQGNELCDKYVYAVLDPARRGKDYVSMPICKRKDNNYYLIDVLYQRKPMTDLYDEIVDRIIKHRITTFVIENNTDTSLKTLLEKLLEEKGYGNCYIREKYNVENKEKRIKDARGLLKKNILFLEDYRYTKQSEYGQFMKYFTTYSFDYHNTHDDAPDSLALFTNEIILEKSIVPRATAVSRSGL